MSNIIIHSCRGECFTFDDVECIEHHGVLGQKWGVRRYQNKDGSLTAAGKQKYLISTKTDNGEKITIEQNERGKIAKFLRAHSSKIKEEQDKTLDMVIKNSSGKKVGDLLLYNEGNNSLNVNWIGINEKERGNGYASAAMKSVIDHAKKNGYSRITLEVPGSSPDARHIYEKIGFKSAGTISDKNDVWGGLTSMVYEINNNQS